MSYIPRGFDVIVCRMFDLCSTVKIFRFMMAPTSTAWKMLQKEQRLLSFS